MKIVPASAVIMNSSPDLEKFIELAGRVCYKSEDLITEDSAYKFIKRMLDSKHESVLEHGSITVRFVNDRGVSHEEVRHRLCSFSQESTRYCNYGKEKFGNEITVIDISGGFPGATESQLNIWMQACQDSERHYMALLAEKASPQFARSVLNNSLKTELVWTANPREWRWIFLKREHKTAHPQMRELMTPLLVEFTKRWPALFDDIKGINEEF